MSTTNVQNEDLVVSLVSVCEILPDLLSKYLEDGEKTDFVNELDLVLSKAECTLSQIRKALSDIQLAKTYSFGPDEETLRSLFQALTSDRFREPTAPHNKSWFSSGETRDWQGINVVEPGSRQITSIDMGGDVLHDNLNSLPSVLCDLKHLSELDLSKSSCLLALPDEIGRLKKLRLLNCTRCIALKTLPDSIGDCTSLHTLILSDCQMLERLPDSIGQLCRLTTLKFGANVTSGCNALKTLPMSLGNCNQLRELDLTKCKFLNELPESIGNLQNMTELNLRECKALGFLPSNLGSCVSLRDLGLSKCVGLQELPMTLKLLKNLLRLNISKCTGFTSGEKIMDAVFDIPSLEILNMRGCKNISSLPEIPKTALKKIKQWDLRGSKKLTSLPVSIEHLRNTIFLVDIRECKNLGDLQIHQGIVKLREAGCAVMTDEDHS